jgi:CubicO group peptidase (beta-lactamase class C family)
MQPGSLSARFVRHYRLLYLVVLLLVAGCEPKVPNPVTPQVLTFPTLLRVQAETEVEATTRISTRFASSLPGTLLRYGHVYYSNNASPGSVKQQTVYTQPFVSPFTIESTLSGLQPGTLYYVRVYLETTTGTYYGPVSTIRTTPGLASRLATQLTDSLHGRDFGYSFAVYEKNQLMASGGGGFQSRSVESTGAKAFTANSKMHIASMSKTITAMAFVKVSATQKITPNTLIIDYLPPRWPKGPNINEITFDDLLTHRSGLAGLKGDCANGEAPENTWSGLKELVSKGVKSEDYGTYCYQNANYGLFRILLARLLGYQFTNQDSNDEIQTQRLFETYIRTELFGASRIPVTPFLDNPSLDPTFGYEFPYTGSKGFNPGNLAAQAGGYGLYLTAHEAAALYARAFSPTDQSLLSQEQKNKMINREYGIFQAETPAGPFTYHDGWWYFRPASDPTLVKGFRSIWMHCPGDILVVLYANGLDRDTSLFPLRSKRYDDIESFVLWAYGEAKGAVPARRMADPGPNFRTYLRHPGPH